MSSISNISRVISPRSLLLTTALAATLAVAGSTSGHAAAANAQIHGNGFSATPIKVISENGTSWTKIEERTLGLPVTIQIGMDGFYVEKYTVRQKGQPEGEHIESNDTDHDTVNTSPTLVGSTQLMTAAERQAVIAECNERLTQGQGIHQDHNTFSGVGVVLSVHFEGTGIGGQINQNGAGAPHISYGTVTLPVHCVGAKKPPQGPSGEASVPPNFKVTGIDLRFMTSLGYTQQVDSDTRCKLTQVRVRIPTTKAGPVRFKLWTKIGSAPASDETIDAWSSFAGPGKFEAVYDKALPVTKTTNIQAKAEELVNPIGLSTNWKDVTVHCKTERGGLASTPTAPTALPVVMGRPGIIVVRPQANPRPGIIVTPRPTRDVSPQRGALVKLKAETSGRPVFASGRFQRQARPF